MNSGISGAQARALLETVHARDLIVEGRARAAMTHNAIHNSWGLGGLAGARAAFSDDGNINIFADLEKYLMDWDE